MQGIGNRERVLLRQRDVIGRVAAYDAIVRNEKIKTPNLPASFNVLINELKGIGLDVDFCDDNDNSH